MNPDFEKNLDAIPDEPDFVAPVPYGRSGASPCSPIDHLVMLHRVLYNTVTDREALDYLNRFRREDADFADMGRPLKSQYQENS